MRRCMLDTIRLVCHAHNTLRLWHASGLDSEFANNFTKIFKNYSTRRACGNIQPIWRSPRNQLSVTRPSSLRWDLGTEATKVLQTLTGTHGWLLLLVCLHSWINSSSLSPFFSHAMVVISSAIWFTSFTCNTQWGRQTCRQWDRQTVRQTDSETDRQ